MLITHDNFDQESGYDYLFRGKAKTPQQQQQKAARKAERKAKNPIRKIQPAIKKVTTRAIQVPVKVKQTLKTNFGLNGPKATPPAAKPLSIRRVFSRPVQVPAPAPLPEDIQDEPASAEDNASETELQDASSNPTNTTAQESESDSSSGTEDNAASDNLSSSTEDQSADSESAYDEPAKETKKKENSGAGLWIGAVCLGLVVTITAIVLHSSGSASNDPVKLSKLKF